MSTSVNTNPGALLALRNLENVNRDLETVQRRINTGLNVSSAKEDGAIYAIAQQQRADVSAYGSVSQSLKRGISIVDIALAAGEQVSDLLVELKSKAISAADPSLAAEKRAVFEADFVALRDTITQVLSTAEFDGTNLLNGSSAGLSVLASSDGTTTIDVGAVDLSLGGTVITVDNTATPFATPAAAAAQVAAITTSLDNVNSTLATLGTSSKSLELQDRFVTQLSDALEVGIGNLVDADLARESSRLQSLQVQQQLGIQALSIANAAPQTLLSLFGG